MPSRHCNFVQSYRFALDLRRLASAKEKQPFNGRKCGVQSSDFTIGKCDVVFGGLEVSCCGDASGAWRSGTRKEVPPHRVASLQPSRLNSIVIFHFYYL